MDGGNEERNNSAHNDGTRAWHQTFDCDRYGNRGMNVMNTSDNADAANSALQLADFSETNNRITRAGFAYDAAGNLIAEPGKSYTYDAENKIVTAVKEIVNTTEGDRKSREGESYACFMFAVIPFWDVACAH